jgi:hypothetical protein
MKEASSEGNWELGWGSVGDPAGSRGWVSDILVSEWQGPSNTAVYNGPKGGLNAYNVTKQHQSNRINPLVHIHKYVLLNFHETE